jgi:D-sedoheptulose 7-phosphate isomerase
MTLARITSVSTEEDDLTAIEAAHIFHQELAEHIETAKRTQATLEEPFKRLLTRALDVLTAGGKLLFFGNGGSAADAQHLATELTVRFSKNRPALAALALTTDTSALTAIGNDLGFEYVFARQIEALGQRGDLAIAISTSGTSRNVLLGLQTAREKGLYTAAFGGHAGGEMVKYADPILIVPSHVTSRIQEMHITLGQMLCGAIEKRLGLV